MDFTKLKSAGIFTKVESQFKWEASSLSENESSQGHKKEILMVRSLLFEDYERRETFYVATSIKIQRENGGSHAFIL